MKNQSRVSKIDTVADDNLVGESQKDQHSNKSEIALQLVSNKQKVLVVEDSITEIMRIKAMLTKLEYDVTTAKNGKEALEKLDDEKFKLIISDWRMPHMTGIDLCRHIRNNSEYGHPYFILLTGCNQQMDLVAGMEAGADDFITKPFITEELRVRLKAGARIVALQHELEKHNDMLRESLENEEKHMHRIQEDMKSAAQMQQQLLPSGASPFPSTNICTLFKPATIVAGDTYGYFRLNDHYLGFYQLDVAGHGIASAMLSFTLSRFLSPEQGLLTTARPDGISVDIVPPDEVVSALNERFLEKECCEHYFTMVYGVLNVKNGRGEFCQAGHPHPVVSTQDGSTKILGNGGFPVGMLPEAKYESIPFELDVGDRIWLYSDGITECRNKNNHILGMEKFVDVIQHTIANQIDKISIGIDNLLHKWHGDRPLEDDISLLVIEYSGTDELRPLDILNLKAQAVAPEVVKVTEEVDRFLMLKDLPAETRFQVTVVLAEALNNIIEHALPNNPEESIRLKCKYFSDRLELELTDDGVPLSNFPNARIPEHDAESGRGWPIIIHWMDEVSLNRKHDSNCLFLKKFVRK